MQCLEVSISFCTPQGNTRGLSSCRTPQQDLWPLPHEPQHCYHNRKHKIIQGMHILSASEHKNRGDHPTSSQLLLGAAEWHQTGGKHLKSCFYELYVQEIAPRRWLCGFSNSNNRLNSIMRGRVGRDREIRLLPLPSRQSKRKNEEKHSIDL